MDMTNEQMKSRFLDETKNHSMKVIHDDGVNRHLSFTNNGSSFYRYDITTWGQFLCYSGDMGCFVFSRIEDMFEFFRGNSPNFGYWGEKLEADGRNEGYIEYSVELFNESVRKHIKTNWEFDDEEQKAEIMNDVEDLVIGAENEHEARASTFSYCSDAGHEFLDFFEERFTKATFRYIWACYAIQKGIKQYDEFKNQ